MQKIVETVDKNVAREDKEKEKLQKQLKEAMSQGLESDIDFDHRTQRLPSDSPQNTQTIGGPEPTANEFFIKYDDDFDIFKCKYRAQAIPRAIKLVATSLVCRFDSRSKLRNSAVQLSYHAAFNNMILACILLNTVCMALFDQEQENRCIHKHSLYNGCPQELQSKHNQVLTWLGHVFGIVFTLEATIKIVAMGFIKGQNTYLKDVWNLVDFIVVVSWIFELITQFFSFPGINLRPLRTLRLFRPLKAMKTVPSLRKQITALFRSIKGLLNVIVFITAVLMLFSILGLTLFSGTQNYTCRESTTPHLNSKVWKKQATNEFVCIPKTRQVFSNKIVDYTTCPSNFEEESICGSVLDYGLTLKDDRVEQNMQLQHGVASFDQFFSSVLAVFQIVTLDNWSLIMYNLANGNFMPLIPYLYCVILVFLGNYFMLNLMLAVVLESYLKSEIETDKEIKEQLLQKQNFIDKQEKSVPQIQIEMIPMEVEHSFIEKKEIQSNLSGDDSASSNKISTPKVSLSGQVNQTQFLSIKKKNKPLSERRAHSFIENTTQKLVPEKQDSVIAEDAASENMMLKKLMSQSPLMKQMTLSTIRRYGNKLLEKELEVIHAEISKIKDKNLQEQLRNEILSRLNEALRTQDGEKQIAFKQGIIIQEGLLQIQNKVSILNFHVPEPNQYGLVDEGRMLKGMRNEISGQLHSKDTADTEDLDDMVDQVQIATQKKHVLKHLSVYLKKKFSPKKQISKIAEKSIQMIEKNQLLQRASKNKLFSFFLTIISSKLFGWFINLSIIANTLILALDHHPMDPDLESNLEKLNLVLTGIFTFEMIFKMIGLGCRNYLDDRANQLDLTIVLFSFVDVFIYVQASQDGSQLDTLRSAATVFRILRLIRILKLAKSWQNFNYFLITIGSTIMKMSSFAVILFLFIFIFAMMGMEFYAQKVRFNFDMEKVEYFGSHNNTSKLFSVPPANFDNFVNSILTVFVVLANDGWTPIYWDHYRVAGKMGSTIYFHFLVVFGQWILFNLFLAILLKEFDENSIMNDREQDEEGELSCSQKLWQILQPKKEEGEKQDNRSLYIFSEENKCRKFLIELTHSNKFETFILTAIIISSISLTIEHPLNDPEGQLVKILKIVDYCTTSVFTFEAIAKIIALGLIFNGDDSYLQNTTNILDIVIVVPSIISYFPIQMELQFFKIIRMFRLLRPLRFIGKNANLKISIQALYVSLPAIGSLFVIVLLIFLIFAIVAVNLFKGKGFYCDTSQLSLDSVTVQSLINTREDCANYGGVWSRYHHHFDNCVNAVMQMYIMSQTVNWAIMMFRTMDSRGPELVPGYKESPITSGIFYVSFIFFVSLFIMNLFVGVIISAFNKERDKLGRNFLLTSSQRSKLETKILVLKMNPKLALLEPKASCRKPFYRLALSRKFEIVILTAITLNSLLMAVNWPNQSESTIQIIKRVNYCFLGIFVFEAIVKFIAFDIRYFKDSWNIFDFIIVLASIIVLIITNFAEIKALSSLTQLLRVFRLGRLFKLFKSLKALQIIASTIMQTLPSIMNIGLLMFLIIFIYAVLGINLFATVKPAPPMNKRLNFDNFSNAFMTLIRICTGECWNDLMEVLSRQQTPMHFCVTGEQSYTDYMAAGYKAQGCGVPFAWLYFISYTFLLTLVFLNLFIAIILDGYFEASSQTGQTLTPCLTAKCLDSWSIYDPDATGIIPMKDFPALMFSLGSPLGWDSSFDEQRQKRFTKMVFDQQPKEIQFNEFLDKIVLLYVIRTEIKEAMNTSNSDMNSCGLFDSQSQSQFSKKEPDKEQPNMLIKRRQSLALAMAHASNEIAQVAGRADIQLVQDLEVIQRRLTMKPN